MNMKKAILIPLCFLVATVFAQDLNFQWSDPVLVEKKLGLTESILGANDNTVFTLKSGKKGQKIVAYDKSSLKMKKELIIKGAKGSVLDSKEFSKLALDFFHITPEKILVFFSQESKSIERIFALELTTDLVVVGTITKIHEIEVDKGKVTKTLLVRNKNNPNTNFVLVNEKFNDNNILAEYKVYNSDLKLADVGKIELPFNIDKKNRTEYIQRSYRLSDNNILCTITPSKEENPGAPRRKRWTYFTTIGLTDVSSGDSKIMTLKSDERKYDDITFVSDGSNLFIAGFYYNPDDDGDFQYVTGFFSTKVNFQRGDLSEVQLFEYDENFYRHFKNNQKAEESNRKAKKEEKRAKYIIERMTIEQIAVGEGKINVVCSGMINKSVTTCNSKGQCTTRYYCVKLGVIAFNTDRELKVKSYDVLPRMMVYDGWDVPDVSIAPLKNDAFMVNYGSAFELEGGAMTGNPKRKDKDVRRSQLEYAILNDEGVLERHEMKLSKINGKESKDFNLDENGVNSFAGEVFAICAFRIDGKYQIAIGKVIEK
jgi:hypothetical protein